MASGETERVKILNGKATTVCVCHGAISKKIDGRGMCGRLAGCLSDETMDYGRPLKPFFIEILIFWLGQINLGDRFLGIWGYFRPIYQHTFWYSESLAMRTTRYGMAVRCPVHLH